MKSAKLAKVSTRTWHLKKMDFFFLKLEMLQLHFGAFLVHKILHFLTILGLLSHSSNLDGPGQKCEVITDNSTFTPFLSPRRSSSMQTLRVLILLIPDYAMESFVFSSSETKTMNSQLSV